MFQIKLLPEGMGCAAEKTNFYPGDVVVVFNAFVNWFSLVVILIWPASGFALSIPFGELIANGGFQTTTGISSLTGWAGVGTTNGQASAGDLNALGGNAGFNGFFTSAFAALGDSGGPIGDDPSEGTHRLSQTFELPFFLDDVAIESYDLAIGFSTVFDGSDDNSSVAHRWRPDRFSAELNGIPLFSQSSFTFPNGAPATISANNQLVNAPLATFLFGLQPGGYTLTFSLFEDNGTGDRFTNTAAGIDNVSVLGTANAAPVPEPTTLLLLGGGLAALARYGRRNRPR